MRRTGYLAAPFGFVSEFEGQSPSQAYVEIARIPMMFAKGSGLFGAEKYLGG